MACDCHSGAVNSTEFIPGLYTIRHISEIHNLEDAHHYCIILSLKYLYNKCNITLNLQKYSH